jgi:hypothetical protein
MAFIGNTVQTQGFTPAIDYFNGNGVTVTFTLSRPVASVAQMIVAIDNVIQNPSSAFNVSGNAITFTSAPLSGTNNIWVEYTSLITTYQGISQDPSVIGDITATGGFLSTGDFGNSFIDGAVIDYVTGAGRITVGELDNLIFYHGGTSGRSEMMKLSYAGNSTLAGNLVISGSVTSTGNAPQTTVYTSGSGTYTTPTSCRYLYIEMIGGGGGGGGSGSASGGNGGAGGNTTFGSSLLTASGGGSGPWAGGGGVGGTSTISSPANGFAVNGGAGGASPNYNALNYANGGTGGSGIFGGGGSSGSTFGGGGNGALTSGTAVANGGGGGAGGGIKAYITSPAATYSYAIGAAGTAGTAGTNGNAGTAGTAGAIFITAFF